MLLNDYNIYYSESPVFLRSYCYFYEFETVFRFYKKYHRYFELLYY